MSPAGIFADLVPTSIGPTSDDLIPANARVDLLERIQQWLRCVRDFNLAELQRAADKSADTAPSMMLWLRQAAEFELERRVGRVHPPLRPPNEAIQAADVVSSRAALHGIAEAVLRRFDEQPDTMDGTLGLLLALDCCLRFAAAPAAAAVH